MGAEKRNTIFLSSRECRYETAHARIFAIMFLSALIWVQTVCKGYRSADDTSTDDYGHKWALKKRNITLSSRVAKAYEQILAITPTATK